MSKGRRDARRRDGDDQARSPGRDGHGLAGVDPAPGLPAGGQAGAALAASGLVIAFPGAGPVLTIPGLTLPPGSATAVQGPSGAGKTSLLHALAGIERPSAGSVRWDGDDVWAMPGAGPGPVAAGTAGTGVPGHAPAARPVRAGQRAAARAVRPRPHSRRPAPARAGIAGRLGRVRTQRRAAVLSRGERQRVALARALFRRPAILLADEPTASLDAAAGREVGTLLLDAAAAGGATLLVATHDPALLDRLPRRLRLDAGQLQGAA